jgi:hypothetical protein
MQSDPTTHLAINRHLKKSDPVMAAIIERVGRAACSLASPRFTRWRSRSSISS